VAGFRRIKMRGADLEDLAIFAEYDRLAKALREPVQQKPVTAKGYISGSSVMKALGPGVSIAVNGTGGRRADVAMAPMCKADAVVPGDNAARLPAHLRKGHYQEPLVISHPQFTEPGQHPIIGPMLDDRVGSYSPVQVGRVRKFRAS
jgi:hypothetical protein